MSLRGFTWRDADRTIRFGEGVLGGEPLLRDGGYTLLTTPRTAKLAPEVLQAARTVVEVEPGPVDALAAALLERIEGGQLVALGGGRVIDVAKAVSAARGPGVPVAAIPTTLSAAEMTGTHRHAAGVDPSTPRVRPSLVLNDPALSASQPHALLAASAANSLAHAIESACASSTSPVPSLAAARAVVLIAGAYGARHGDGANPDRAALALGALLSGYALDATGYGLHHVLAQTVARETGLTHAYANAVLLPHTILALRARDAQTVAALDREAGAALAEPDIDDSALEVLARRLAALAGMSRLELEDVTLDRVAAEAALRAELARTPPQATAAELREILRSARAW